jgi:transcriptional regulator with XRE-family HTH domain
MFNILNIKRFIMKLAEIGNQLKHKRLALGFTQAQVAKFSDLSRTTVNQLENGTLSDLGYVKLMSLLAILGLDLDARPAKGLQNGLSVAARTVSTSYRDVLTPIELATILSSGQAPAKFHAHLMTLLDETPLPIVVKAIVEASKGSSTKLIMQNINKFADEMHIQRKVW